MKFCVSRGTENEDDAVFCTKCGYNFNEESKTPMPTTETSRTMGLVLGIIGAIFGLIGGVFAIILSAFGGSEILALGISAIIASIVGIVGSVYVKSNAKIGNNTNYLCNMVVNKYFCIWNTWSRIIRYWWITCINTKISEDTYLHIYFLK